MVEHGTLAVNALRRPCHIFQFRESQCDEVHCLYGSHLEPVWCLRPAASRWEQGRGRSPARWRVLRVPTAWRPAARSWSASVGRESSCRLLHCNDNRQHGVGLPPWWHTHRGTTHTHRGTTHTHTGVPPTHTGVPPRRYTSGTTQVTHIGVPPIHTWVAPRRYTHQRVILVSHAASSDTHKEFTNEQSLIWVHFCWCCRRP